MDEVKFLPVFTDAGFLAGVRFTDPGDHPHKWIISGNMLRCSCGLVERLYTVKEAMDVANDRP